MLVKYNNSYMRTEKGLSYIRLNEKDYYSTGYAYGQLLVKSNHHTVHYMKKTISRMAISSFYFITKRFYRRLRIPKEYLEELRGYADATGISYDHLFCLNFGYDIIKRYGLHCSTISFFNKDSVIVGRNTDLAPGTTRFALKHAKSIIVDVSIPGKNRFTHVSVPLLVGAINGFNEKGIAVNSHQVIPTKEKPHPIRLATPLLSRIILEESNNLKDAVEVVKKNITHRVVNIALTSEKERKSIICEIHPSKAHFVYKNDNSCTCCTTHYESRQMRHFHNNHPQQSVRERLSNTKLRIKTMRELTAIHHEVTYQDMIKILQDHSNGIEFYRGAKSLSNNGTYQSFVFDLTHNFIWISNGDKAPVSLTGEFVKFKVNVGK